MISVSFPLVVAHCDEFNFLSGPVTVGLEVLSVKDSTSFPLD